MSKTPKGFSTDLSGRESACIAIFGAEGSGKTRLCATAGEYSKERNERPGWLIMDRKTRKTIRQVCADLGIEHPFINAEDFISQKDALALATNENFANVTSTYVAAIKSLFDAAVQLGADPAVNPIVFDSGTALWDWIAFSHFGRKQDVGKSRVWGPPKQDWTDLMDALSHKTVLITLRAKDEYRNDSRTGQLTWDGPPHLGFTVTSVVRLTSDGPFDEDTDKPRKLREDETYMDRFSLDVVESQDNKGLEGVNRVLTGENITYGNLMAQLRPEE